MNPIDNRPIIDKEDKKKSFELHLRSALRNDHQSVEEVARCYYFGIGVKRDKRVARIWYERAKEIGVGEANDPININS